MNWLLIVVLAIIAVCMLIGYFKGFVKMLFSLCSIVLAIVLVSAVRPYVNEFLRTSTPLYNTVKNSADNMISEQFGYGEEMESIDSDVSAQVKAIEQMELPGILKNSLLENNNAEVYRMLAVSKFSDYVSGYIAYIAVNAVGFVFSFLFVMLILSVIFGVLDIMAKLPVIHGINKIAGCLLGLAEGLVIVWIGCILLTIFGSTDLGQETFRLISQDAILGFLYNNNLLLKGVISLAAFV